MLRRSLDPLGDVLTVAPAHEASAVARGITIGRPIKLGHVRFGDGFGGVAVEGTPVDCVRVAMLGVLGPPPDIIVSGINYGYNLGDDVTYSGTVGAALEGALMGLPGVAISIESRDPSASGGMERCSPPWSSASCWRPCLGGRTKRQPAGHAGRAAARHQGHQPRRRQLSRPLGPSSDDGVNGEYRIVCERAPLEPWAANDFEAVAEGYVSLTPLQFDLTSREGLASLAAWPVADLLRAARTRPG